MSDRTCSLVGCVKPVHARDRCQKHYREYMQQRPDRSQCERCERPAYAKGLCRSHYDSILRSDYWAKRATDPTLSTNHQRAREKWADDPVNRERHNAARRAQDAVDPEAHRARTKAWRLANPERVRELGRQHVAKRKAWKLGQVVTQADYRAILIDHGMVCHICGEEIKQGDLHFDHVIPLSRGGSHQPDNIRPAHAVCNLRKGARLLTGSANQGGIES